MYFTAILILHSLICLTLIGLVLLQQGKGADAGATISGGGGNTVFGAAGAADFLTKLTTGLAVAFMVTSVLLIRSYQHGGSATLNTLVGQSAEGDLLKGSIMEDLPDQAAEAIVDGDSVEAVESGTVGNGAVENSAVAGDAAAIQDGEDGMAKEASVVAEEAVAKEAMADDAQEILNKEGQGLSVEKLQEGATDAIADGIAEGLEAVDSDTLNVDGSSSNN